jgi:hypothetical protein
MCREDAEPSSPVEQSYRARLEELGAEKQQLDTRDSRLSTARGITFLAAGGSGLYALIQDVPDAWWLAAGTFAVFMFFVVLHAIVSTKQFDVERRISFYQRGNERLAGSYRAPDKEAHRRGDEHRDGEHPYTSDLDVFGSGSLFEQLNTTQTPGGADRLAEWLKQAAAPDVVRARQRAVQELAAHDALREELSLAGMRAARVDPDARPFIRWAAEKSPLREARAVLAAAALVLVPATVALLAGAWSLPGAWRKAWLVGAGLQILLLMASRARVEPVVGPIALKQSPLGRYHALIALLEAQSFDDERLVQLQHELEGPDGEPASLAMQKLERLASLAAARHNAIIAVVANVLLSWDLLCAVALDRWRDRCGERVARWLDALAEFEALAAVATFAHEHPAYAYPEIAQGGGHYQASALGHPLIPPAARVCNELRLDDETRALMITGSNMSGKSTMLRSIGLNAVLALAGAPVCAESMTMSALRLQSSVRVDDSLERGASRFFAEVTKLKRVVDSLDDDDTPVLFLLDEVLHGTNSRERVLGAKAVVQHLVERRAIGAVTSHDLGLVALEELTERRVRNVHFEDHIEGGAMCFDYRMKQGPVGTSNALRLMRMVGLDMVDADSGTKSDGDTQS